MKRYRGTLALRVLVNDMATTLASDNESELFENRADFAQ
jgi:hypothetical protein